MSKQKRFSKLAIAAGLLLTASATCFAQTESLDSQTETAPVAVAMNSKPKADARVATTNTSIAADTNSTLNPTKFSVTKFMESAKQSLTNSSLTVAPTTVYQINVESKMTADDFSEPAKTKAITFVPSRGPRLPQ